MIVVTGAFGFIGSCLVRRLNDLGHKDLILIDDFTNKEKIQNLQNKHYHNKIHRDKAFEWLRQQSHSIDLVFHMGARTDTTEMDSSIFDRLNLNYSKKIWEFCSNSGIPMIYASSAATYGMGEHGFADNHEIIPELQPLNPYGISKNEFDKWAVDQQDSPPFWIGLKFFNVYGPNEYHKGRMASVVFHCANQIRTTGQMKLFRSHNPLYRDGEQKRDFIYVKDIVNICIFFMNNRTESGLYNVGTGRARTFKDLATNAFKAMNVEPLIEYIDTPEDIRDTYQYFTEADMRKLRSAGYSERFATLEEGIIDYISHYLMYDKTW